MGKNPAILKYYQYLHKMFISVIPLLFILFEALSNYSSLVIALAG